MRLLVTMCVLSVFIKRKRRELNKLNVVPLEYHNADSVDYEE